MAKLIGEKKLIGFFSHTPDDNVFCDGDACVIAASKKLMIQYIEKHKTFSQFHDKIKKTTFGEIIQGIKSGAEYALDKESYAEFFPLAKKHGIQNLPSRESLNCGDTSCHDDHFVIVKLPDEQCDCC
tara:strand:+ start:555 stop:935 length:381 start_codon:yes stop_codon:yes gene_type:complete